MFISAYIQMFGKIGLKSLIEHQQRRRLSILHDSWKSNTTLKEHCFIIKWLMRLVL
jgi:hypothetical protein